LIRPAPAIAPEIKLSNGGPLANGGSYDWGIRLVGSIADVVFTVRNVGVGDLLLTLPLGAVSGGGAPYSIVQQPNAVVPPNETTTFTVRFAPTSEGPQTATLNIVNNDDAQNPYALGLLGIGALPKLSISKTSDVASAIPGQILNYTLVVKNDGIIEATDVIISDTLPAALTFVGPVTLVGSAGTVAISANDLPRLASGVTIGAGKQVTVTYVVQVNDQVSEGQSVANVAIVGGKGVMAPIGANTDIIVGSAEHETRLTTGPATICPGWLLHYAFRFTNTSDIVIHNLVITAPVPTWASAAWVADDSPLPGRLDAVSGQCLFKASEVPPGEEIVAKAILRGYTSAKGELESVWHYGGDQIVGTKQLTATVRTDQSLCAPPLTPRPTATATVTPMPQRPDLFLPLIVR